MMSRHHTVRADKMRITASDAGRQKRRWSGREPPISDLVTHRARRRGWWGYDEAYDGGEEKRSEAGHCCFLVTRKRDAVEKGWAEAA
jgi:hypothetical protein